MAYEGLMVSVSGVRGRVGEALTPEIIAKFAAGFGAWARGRAGGKARIVLGRDSRVSGPMFHPVVISATKYLNGHSDMVGGICVVRDDALAERIQFILNASGAVPGPFDAWLALRGTKTLHLRMPRHDENGRRIASWLAEKIGAENVIYPGLESHPQHALAKKQMKGFGGMISVLTGSRERAAKILGRVRVFSLAESLGGVESLISHPASMTHASVEPERRAQLGIAEDLIRMSCGVEDVNDLLADLEQAFA